MAQQVQICTESLKSFHLGGTLPAVYIASKSICLHVTQINTSEIYLQVALTLHIRNCFVLWPTCATEALVSAVLSPHLIIEELSDS